MNSTIMLEICDFVERVVNERIEIGLARVEAIEKRLDDPASFVARYGAMVDRGAQALVSLQAGSVLLPQVLTAHDIAKVILDAALRAS